jgi:DNA modification methylase
MAASTILHGNNIELLRTLPDCSIDSIVTDPPYELGFMGKKWDSSGIAYSVELWSECLRVLKHGGHLLAFSGSRTYHRMVVAIEDAGFEIRDQIMWVYGSGFPKSLDISKAIDKAAGAERKVVGDEKSDLFGTRTELREKPAYGIGNTSGIFSGHTQGAMARETIPATDEAQQWSGWGTALKPAHEPIVMARKPIDGTVANNVLKHGVGGINIEASRIASNDGFEKAWDKPISTNISAKGNQYISNGAQHTVDISANKPSGRFPANFIHDGSEEVLALFPTSKSQSGTITVTKSGDNTWDRADKGMFDAGRSSTFEGFGDSGSAARFFYCAKASKAERNAGLEGMPAQRHADRTADDGVGGDNPCNRINTAKQNFHPTVKPIALMRYLVKLVTPPQGTVLDPFTGSGTTLVAAILEGFDCIGMELTADYLPIIEGRVAWAVAQAEIVTPSLFD